MDRRGYIPTKEAARYLGITVDALRKRVERGEVTSYKLGNRRRWFKYDDIDAAMTKYREDEWAS
jgi:excisionase family DNA binding protein